MELLGKPCEFKELPATPTGSSGCSPNDFHSIQKLNRGQREVMMAEAVVAPTLREGFRRFLQLGVSALVLLLLPCTV